MWFLAVYSTTRFWTRCTNSEDSSNISDKKSKNFFQLHNTSNYQKIFKKPDGMHFLTPCTGSFKLSGETLFFIFL